MAKPTSHHLNYENPVLFTEYFLSFAFLPPSPGARRYAFVSPVCYDATSSGYSHTARRPDELVGHISHYIGDAVSLSRSLLDDVQF